MNLKCNQENRTVKAIFEVEFRNPLGLQTSFSIQTPFPTQTFVTFRDADLLKVNSRIEYKLSVLNINGVRLAKEHIEGSKPVQVFARAKGLEKKHYMKWEGFRIKKAGRYYMVVERIAREFTTLLFVRRLKVANLPTRWIEPTYGPSQ